jgi:hypothetical protein
MSNTKNKAMGILIVLAHFALALIAFMAIATTEALTYGGI